jgi:hypothetical protein
MHGKNAWRIGNGRAAHASRDREDAGRDAGIDPTRNVSVGRRQRDEAAITKKKSARAGSPARADARP